jgi:hypothetical protein
MLRIILLLWILFSTTAAFSQSCSCRDELLWVKDFMERNHPGFNSIIKTPDEPGYKKFTDSLLAATSGAAMDKYCIVYLKKYIAYLKDHHSNIAMAGGNGQPVNESSSAAVDSFLNSATYRNTETIVTDSAALVKRLQKSKDPVEGIYQTADSVYTVALIQHKTGFRDYAAIILKSKSLLWTKGQVKFELKQAGKKKFSSFVYYRNHSVNYEENVLFNERQLSFSTANWIKLFPRQAGTGELPAAETISSAIVSFASLDSVTACLSIRSFGGNYNSLFDSAYKKILPRIRKYPNLIIDVRGNGGGSDANYSALLPFIYTDTMTDDRMEIYVTADNKKAYEKMRDLYKSDKNRYGSSGYMTWEFPLRRMKTASRDSFVSMGSGKPGKTVMKPDAQAPKKIAILYNRRCASSCEQLLIDAMFSKKVIRVGENSGGYIAYGNVMNMTTPCGYVLNWTTTRKLNSVQYEFTGIAPHHVIPETETNWLEYTRRLLEKE